jgi:hypothetical protein
MFTSTPLADTSQDVGMCEQESAESTTQVTSSRPKINFTGVATKTSNINLWDRLSPVSTTNLQDILLSLFPDRQ